VGSDTEKCSDFGDNETQFITEKKINRHDESNTTAFFRKSEKKHLNFSPHEAMQLALSVILFHLFYYVPEINYYSLFTMTVRKYLKNKIGRIF
jgi:hypothetical protein